SVGVIDVSTLGGLDIRGPDAAELIERLYTGNFRQQRPGTARYGVMTNEMGTIIDDGVNARFHERHFYVTATTTGVDAVYRKILWWNAQWRLDIDVTNVTATYAAVNLAGPRSRDVLARLCPGMALGPQDFPYMAARLARVAGIEARILRVGFVGELGYEIHVPSGCGEALWDALFDAGKTDCIRPFGVEAQRLLRLEKGHFIVGQDTDGLSHPDEARCAWAVAMKKPFFVGQRAIAMIRRAPPDRSLVGFMLPIDGPMPEEGCLLLEGQRITGYVTSIGRSTSVGAVIGLGLGSKRQAEAGAAIAIKLSDGRIVEARGANLPFFDPENLRQKK
ncbi:MAG: aminomethyl transferase family protein, partial [Alphaproteobacteria bacterium]|nr:aminomethyl transferase family protein [Alphaproteobacteria bacterium]